MSTVWLKLSKNCLQGPVLRIRKRKNRPSNYSSRAVPSVSGLARKKSSLPLYLSVPKQSRSGVPGDAFRSTRVLVVLSGIQGHHRQERSLSAALPAVRDDGRDDEEVVCVLREAEEAAVPPSRSRCSMVHRSKPDRRSARRPKARGLRAGTGAPIKLAWGISLSAGRCCGMS